MDTGELLDQQFDERSQQYFSSSSDFLSGVYSLFSGLGALAVSFPIRTRASGRIQIRPLLRHRIRHSVRCRSLSLRSCWTSESRPTARNRSPRPAS